MSNRGLTPPDGERTGRLVPFSDLEVETETMPDGRRIHYYTWPDAPESATDPDAEPSPDPGDV